MTGCLSMFARLGRDNAGNTLAIAAAALLPMMALIGGGVDISRSYMAKTELQSACDAGVLAGRKAMSKSGSYGTAEKAKATKMFNFNFTASRFNASDVSYETDDNDDGQVLGTATATVPTLVMKIFDKDEVDLSVDCMAELQIGNADVMFVLDNTTSMKCAPEDTATNCTQYAITDSRSKFYGLKEAVKDFHKTINQAVNDNRTRIRYGFVPYAMTVNVGGLLGAGQLASTTMASSTKFQTRTARFATAVYVAGTPTNMSDVTETYTSKITQAQCGNAAGTSNSGNNYGVNKYPSSSGLNPVASGGPAPTATVSTTYQYESWVKTGTQGSGSSKVDIGTCVRRGKRKQTTYTTEYAFTNWIYGSQTVDTSKYKTLASTSYANNTSSLLSARTKSSGTFDLATLSSMASAGTATGTGTNSSSTWNGCIEERQTTPAAASYDFDPIPDDALDLDFDTPPDPDHPETQWKPQWPAMYMDRGTAATANYFYNSSNQKYYNNSGFTGNAVTLPSPSTPTAYCPAQMKLFTTVELSDDPNDIPSWLTTYLGTLRDSGYTYHDVGMIWGGRLTSPTGLFKDNVTLDADKINVSRHIIFMTDGILQPEDEYYSAYGIEKYDHRIAPAGSESTIYNRHMARFVAMCDAIKAQGTTIWVVAFGTTMTTQLQNCATGGRAYYSSNTVALRNTFKYIAAQVADLRIGA